MVSVAGVRVVEFGTNVVVMRGPFLRIAYRLNAATLSLSVTSSSTPPWM